MSRPGHLASPLHLVLGLALVLLLTVAPATAAADPTSANQWAGGTLSPARLPADRNYPVSGTMISLTTSPTRARMKLLFSSPNCLRGTTATGSVTTGIGGDEEHLVLAVSGTRRIRTKTASLTVGVTLRSAAPGVLAGTATIRGTYREDGRPRRCDRSSAVVLRSRSALNRPLQPLSTDPALPRVGGIASTIAPRVRGSFAITKRADGFHHVLFTAHSTCRSGTGRSSFDALYLVPRFRIAADGTFRGDEDVRTRGRSVRGRRTSYRFVSIIRGRIDADGVARGTVSTMSRNRETGYADSVCRVAPTTFAAAP